MATTSKTAEKIIDTIQTSGFFKQLLSASNKVSSMRFMFVIGGFSIIIGTLAAMFYSIHKDGGTGLLGVAAVAGALLTPLCSAKYFAGKAEANNSESKS